MNVTNETILLGNIVPAKVGFKVRPIKKAVVDEYREVIDQLPAIEVWVDGNNFVIIDGEHRREAFVAEGRTEIPAHVYHDLSRVDAEVMALAANLAPQLALTKVERKRVIREIILRRHERVNAWIAREAKCSPNTVISYREDLENDGAIPVHDKLLAENGNYIKRQYDVKSKAGAGREDGDFFDEADEREKATNAAKEDGVAPETFEHDVPVSGGYEGDDENDIAKGAAEGPILGTESHVTRNNGIKQAKFEVAQVGEPVSVGLILYIDGLPVTVEADIYVVDGQVSGANGKAVLLTPLGGNAWAEKFID